MTSDDITRILAELGICLEQQEQRIQQQQIQQQRQQIQSLSTENERLKQLLYDKGAAKGSKSPVMGFVNH